MSCAVIWMLSGGQFIDESPEARWFRAKLAHDLSGKRMLDGSEWWDINLRRGGWCDHNHADNYSAGIFSRPVSLTPASGKVSCG
jgi:hypothetical protein